MSKAAMQVKVEEIRKKIGAAAADAVQLLRHELDQVHQDQRALALSMQGFEKDVDAAKAAPAELRGRVFDCADQLEAIRLRLQKVATLDQAQRLMDRVDILDDARRETRQALKVLHADLVDRFTQCPRWRWIQRRSLAQVMILVAVLRENVE